MKRVGRLTIEQVRKMMRDVAADAERELTSARDYEDFRYASGYLRGCKMQLHTVLLTAGLRVGSVLQEQTSFNKEFDAWWDSMNDRIEFHLKRVIELSK